MGRIGMQGSRDQSHQPSDTNQAAEAMAKNATALNGQHASMISQLNQGLFAAAAATQPQQKDSQFSQQQHAQQ